jgi:hypothetical protein
VVFSVQSTGKTYKRHRLLGERAEEEEEDRPEGGGGEEVDPEGKGPRRFGAALSRGPPPSPGGGKAADRAAVPKEGVLPGKAAAGTADRGEEPAAAGAAFFTVGDFGAAVVTKKPGGTLHGRNLGARYSGFNRETRQTASPPPFFRGRPSRGPLPRRCWGPPPPGGRRVSPPPPGALGKKPCRRNFPRPFCR